MAAGNNGFGNLWNTEAFNAFPDDVMQPPLSDSQRLWMNQNLSLTHVAPEPASMNRNLSGTHVAPEAVRPAGVYRSSPIQQPPITLPEQPMVYAPQSMVLAGGNHLPQQSQISFPMIQNPSHMIPEAPSQLMPTGKGKRTAEEPASGSGISRKERRGRLSKKAWERIHALRERLPHPPKEEDAATILADVYDYMIQLKRREQQLKDELARRPPIQQSQLVTGMGHRTMAAQDYSMPADNSVFGLVQMPNNVVGTPGMATVNNFPFNHLGAGAGEQSSSQGSFSFGANNYWA